MTKNIPVIKTDKTLTEGSNCEVVKGTHKGKSGIVRDLNISKTGHQTITVVQDNGVRFKTLGANVIITKGAGGKTK